MTIHIEGYDAMKSSFQLYLFMKVPVPTSLLTLCSVFLEGKHLL